MPSGKGGGGVIKKYLNRKYAKKFSTLNAKSRTTRALNYGSETYPQIGCSQRMNNPGHRHISGRCRSRDLSMKVIQHLSTEVFFRHNTLVI